MSLNITWCLWHVFWYESSRDDVCQISNAIFPFTNYTSFIATMFCLCLMSIEKYLMVSRPLRYHALLRSTLRVKVLLVVVFVVWTPFCVVQLPWPGLPFHSFFADRCSGRRVLTDFPVWLTTFQRLGVAIPAGLTALVVTVVNITLLHVARRQIRRVDAPDIAPSMVSNTHVDAPRGRRRFTGRGRNRFVPEKGIVTVILITCSFYGCWIPYFFADVTSNAFLIDLTLILAGIGGWLQPVIYITTTKEAKDIIRRYGITCTRR
ncbi:beta-2 adrenergic receptor-like [Diadema antillarum]|uniref:beta-2 adrenergic receptor-like n=1 Tax=Diadema antillarum TaxID=105358 RepID=UPI003A836506